KLVKTAVKIIASGTCHYRRGSSAGAAVLGGRGFGEDAKFLNRIDRSLQRVAAIHAVEIGYAVEKVSIRLGPLAVHGVRLAGAKGTSRLGKSLRHGRDAGLQKAQLGEVAAVERQFDQLSAGNHIADHIGSGVYQRRVRGDVDGVFF